MSMIATPAPVPATIPATVAKTFGDNIGGLVSRVIPVTVPDLDLFKPSDIRMSDSAARAAMNAKLDKGEQAHAFVQGFVFLAVRLAWGSIKLDSALQGQTKYGEFALRKFAASLTGTSGITAGLLRMATESALSAMLELPAPAKKAKSAPAPAPAQITAPAPDVEKEPLTREQLAQQSAARVEHLRMQSRLRLVAQGERYNAHTRAILKAEKEARDAFSGMTAPAPANVIRGALRGLSEFAQEILLRELAAELGFRLSRVPAKKAA